MDNTQTVNYLNNILQYLNDSLNGYQLNKDDLSDARLKSTLEKMCVDRRMMIDEIKFKIKELGGKPNDKQTLAGKLHQFYQDIKNALTNADTLAISRQIRFGESVLIDAYKSALNATLPGDIRQLLLNQLNKIEDGLKEVEIETVKTD